ncbi:Na+/serine symporter [Streptococcus pneumoniae]|nr:Na+/serine symporter [Streptococcus pneumoniae]VOC45120.1 Na+/serine symporter [Streptococcus pneumoniae]VQB19860.1 Na+/serine symporter [Streptococcus pneumoniae]VSV05282.1 Na+/serine symporter [Streptococcus pneumoniae]
MILSIIYTIIIITTQKGDYYDWYALWGILGLTLPNLSGIGLLGDLFVGGLKAVAPILVFALVANALSQHQKGQDSNMKTVVFLYIL